MRLPLHCTHHHLKLHTQQPKKGERNDASTPPLPPHLHSDVVCYVGIATPSPTQHSRVTCTALQYSPCRIEPYAHQYSVPPPPAFSTTPTSIVHKRSQFVQLTFSVTAQEQSRVGIRGTLQTDIPTTQHWYGVWGMAHHCPFSCTGLTFVTVPRLACVTAHGSRELTTLPPHKPCITGNREDPNLSTTNTPCK